MVHQDSEQHLKEEKKNKKGLPEAIKCKLFSIPCPRVPKVFMSPQCPAHHKVQNIFLEPLRKLNILHKIKKARGIRKPTRILCSCHLGILSYVIPKG